MISDRHTSPNCVLAAWPLMAALLAVIAPWPMAARAQDNHAVSSQSDSQAGLDLILNHRFLPRDFHQSTFDELWKDWPEPLRSQAAQASQEQRTRLAFDRYGFSPRDNDSSKPLQYTVDGEGWWAMNCFACHGGSVAGKSIPGAPNSLISLQTLYDDLRQTKQRLKRPLNQMDLGSMVVPMGTTVGTSNAVVFGIALMSFRDKHLNVVPWRLPPEVIHHDMDAPAWWNVRRRERLYIDGFVEKNHRALVPFVMDRRNSGPLMRSWDDEFQLIYTYIESLEPPDYPFEIDRPLARRGEQVFNQSCSECHGSYGSAADYPGRIIPIDDIGTDPVRLRALTPGHRRGYHESWFAHYGEDDTVLAPIGYQAPPLHGIWASAPYLHNGSVPTLWHMLHSDQRPQIWKRGDRNGFDQQRVGLVTETLQQLPDSLRRDERRLYFDTRVRGKSAAGHTYPDGLPDEQKRALLEYLKTL